MTTTVDKPEVIIRWNETLGLSVLIKVARKFAKELRRDRDDVLSDLWVYVAPKMEGVEFETLGDFEGRVWSRSKNWRKIQFSDGSDQAKLWSNERLENWNAHQRMRRALELEWVSHTLDEIEAKLRPHHAVYFRFFRERGWDEESHREAEAEFGLTRVSNLLRPFREAACKAGFGKYIRIKLRLGRRG